MHGHAIINLKTMNQLEEFIARLRSKPEDTEFQEVINIIDKYYQYTPTGFTNGPDKTGVINAEGENEGSCKIFSFAKINGLTVEQTLNCFGRYYRDDVLKNPDGTDHQNIRTFISHGWEHVNFEKTALEQR